MAKNKSTKKNTSTQKTSGQAKKQNVKTKNRGTILTILLVLILLHGILGTFLAYTNLKAGYEASKPWVLAGLSLLTVADVVAAVGMFYWKKWAIYLYAVASIITMAIHVMLTGSMLIAFHDILPVAILGYVINLQHKQDLFE